VGLYHCSGPLDLCTASFVANLPSPAACFFVRRQGASPFRISSSLAARLLLVPPFRPPCHVLTSSPPRLQPHQILPASPHSSRRPNSGLVPGGALPSGVAPVAASSTTARLLACGRLALPAALIPASSPAAPYPPGASPSLSAAGVPLHSLGERRRRSEFRSGAYRPRLPSRAKGEAGSGVPASSPRAVDHLTREARRRPLWALNPPGFPAANGRRHPRLPLWPPLSRASRGRSHGELFQYYADARGAACRCRS
jgi:hypothetical protein